MPYTYFEGWIENTAIVRNERVCSTLKYSSVNITLMGFESNFDEL